MSGAVALIQGLGQALGVLRGAGAAQQEVQAIEDDILALEAVAARDVAAGEQWASKLVARLYGVRHPAAASPIPAAPAPAPAAAVPPAAPAAAAVLAPAADPAAQPA